MSIGCVHLCVMMNDDHHVICLMTVGALHRRGPRHTRCAQSTWAPQRMEHVHFQCECGGGWSIDRRSDSPSIDENPSPYPQTNGDRMMDWRAAYMTRKHRAPTAAGTRYPQYVTLFPNIISKWRVGTQSAESRIALCLFFFTKESVIRRVLVPPLATREIDGFLSNLIKTNCKFSQCTNGSDSSASIVTSRTWQNNRWQV